MTTIAQQIAEIRAIISERQTEAAKPGKGQSLAQHRLEASQAILTTLLWCQGNSDLVRAVKAQGDRGEQG